VEEESKDFKSRYQEIEEEYNRLANLYIASYQIHSTMDVKEVVRISFEIIINLVGSMDFSLYIVDGGSKLVPVCAEGHPLASLPLITLGRGTVGKAAEEKSLYVSAEQMTSASVEHPKVCVPLMVGDKLLGMLVLYSFLTQKECITELDRELFKLLGAHAATALHSSCLNAQVDIDVFDATSYLKLLNS
jgi:hypothetical protein